MFIFFQRRRDKNLSVTENYLVSEVFVFVRSMYREAREIVKGF